MPRSNNTLAQPNTPGALSISHIFHVREILLIQRFLSFLSLPAALPLPTLCVHYMSLFEVYETEHYGKYCT